MTQKKQSLGFKLKNNLDINGDERHLDTDLIYLINEIKDQSSAMIDKVDAYEKKTSISLEKKQTNEKQLPDEFNDSKSFAKDFVSKWQTDLTAMNFDEKNMKDAAIKLKDHRLKLNDLIIKYNFLVFDIKILELTRTQATVSFEL